MGVLEPIPAGRVHRGQIARHFRRLVVPESNRWKEIKSENAVVGNAIYLQFLITSFLR